MSNCKPHARCLDNDHRGCAGRGHGGHDGTNEMRWEPWTPAAEQEERWVRLGRLRDLVEGAAWGRPLGDPVELERRKARIDKVIAAMAELAPVGYFDNHPD